MIGKLDLLRSSPTEELLEEDGFTELLERKKTPKMYIGFEISGKVHLGTGILSMKKVRDFLDAGFDCTIFLADWHSWLNGKLGGDLNKIREVAGGYFKEGLAIGLKCVGGDPTRVHFVLGSQVYNDDYWATLVRVGKSLTVNRVQRMLTIMGRKEGGAVNFAQLIYPPMQITDIFQLGVDVAHGGMDQRKAHIGAREVAEKIGKAKPLALHHHLLLGLTPPSRWPLPPGTSSMEVKSELKMSKSKPDSAIFIHDSVNEIDRKIRSAFCPEREVGFNPVIELAEFVILPAIQTMKIERSERHGGDLDIPSAAELKLQYSRGEIHPLDLKQAVSRNLAEILEPARDYFDGHEDLVSVLEQISVTK